ncbi:MAG: sulfotransferase domain-containing protein [Rhodothermales bacterium]|nr:sulfotransferase domain-containing protein [Rhodothermales bacterium]
MVVLSVGMRKSGTGWYFNMTNALLQAAGRQDIHTYREHPALRGVIKGRKKVAPLSTVKLARMVWAARGGNSFVVKTHAGPSRSLPLFTRLGLVKTTYLYRDPRDVVLSALDHAEAARAAGADIDLRRLTSLDDSLAMVQHELDRWEQWMRLPQVLKVRYEDLSRDTLAELRRLDAFLGLGLPETTLAAVAARYDKRAYGQGRAQRIIGDPLHLNKGVAGRFREEMSAEARAVCDQRLGPYLEKMGYQ